MFYSVKLVTQLFNTLLFFSASDYKLLLHVLHLLFTCCESSFSHGKQIPVELKVKDICKYVNIVEN